MDIINIAIYVYMFLYVCVYVCIQDDTTHKAKNLCMLYCPRRHVVWLPACCTKSLRLTDKTKEGLRAQALVALWVLSFKCTAKLYMRMSTSADKSSRHNCPSRGSFPMCTHTIPPGPCRGPPDSHTSPLERHSSRSSSSSSSSSSSRWRWEQ